MIDAVFYGLLVFVVACALIWLAAKLLLKINGNPDDVFRMERTAPREPKINFRRWIGMS